MSQKMVKKPAAHLVRVFWSFFVTFTGAVTPILKVEGPNHFWIITQSILNQSGWFLAQKIHKNRGNNLIKSEIWKTRGFPVIITSWTPIVGSFTNKVKDFSATPLLWTVTTPYPSEYFSFLMFILSPLLLDQITLWTLQILAKQYEQPLLT